MDAEGISSWAAIALAVATLGGCGRPGDKAEDMIGWSRRNPPVSEETWRDVTRLVCTPSKLDTCGSETCKSVKLSAAPITVVWSPSKGQYRRCDRKGCDDYEPQVSYAGSFANVVVPDKALIFRLTASGEYREILNLSSDTWVYRGHCNRE